MKPAMRSHLAWTAMLGLLSLPLWSLSGAAAAPADIAGVWQGDALRALQLVHKKGGGYRGEVNYLNDTPGTLNGNPVTVTLSGQTVKFSFDRREDSFEGTLSADGKTITGLWRASSLAEGRTEPMTFTRAGADFVVDPAPHKTSFVTVDKGVKLEVL